MATGASWRCIERDDVGATACPLWGWGVELGSNARTLSWSTTATPTAPAQSPKATIAEVTPSARPY